MIIRKQIFPFLSQNRPWTIINRIQSERYSASYEPSPELLKQSSRRLEQAGYSVKNAETITNLMRTITGEA